jgi:hypothetical protein
MYISSRGLVLLASIVMSVFVPAESQTLIATYQGKDVGKAEYSLAEGPDGSVSKSFHIRIQIGDQLFESDTKYRFASSGHAIDKRMFASINGKTQLDLAISFDPKQATLDDKLTGKRGAYPTPASPSPRDLGELWFVRLKPKVGDKVVSSTIAREAGWQTASMTYEADRPFKIGGKSVVGHLIKHVDPSGSWERLVDDRGVPLQFDLASVPGLSFTRR